MKSTTFQIVILVVFGVLLTFAVLIFSGLINVGKSKTTAQVQGNVTLWGTIPRDVVIRNFEEFNRTNKTFTITYIQRNPETFDQDLVEAIASGAGPDLVLLPDNAIQKTENKLYHIPYQSFPERTFRDTYTEEGTLFLAPDGIIGLPLTIDPIIMYYNRNLLEGAGITMPPKTWDEVRVDVPLLTKKDSGGNVIQSALSFGTYANVSHAKDILSFLLLQAGNPIVAYDGAMLTSVLDATLGFAVAPAVSVVDFYTEFADPTKEDYTWNKALPNSEEAFLSEQLAIYFGYASELPLISAKNPNLNFDIAQVPQIKNSNQKVTFGRMYGVAIVKSTKNFPAAFAAATTISGKDFMLALVTKLLEEAPIAPARRDLLATPPQNLYGPTLFNSALIARSWLDPGEAQSGPIFSTMIDNVLRGATSITDAISQASSKLNLSL